MDNEKPIDLRDKIALEVLNAIISNSRDGNSTTQDILYYIEYDSSEDQENKIQRSYAEKRFTKIVRSCYRVADIVRKVRLSPFE
jgi:hypothetical protein